MIKSYLGQVDSLICAEGYLQSRSIPTNYAATQLTAIITESDSEFFVTKGADIEVKKSGRYLINAGGGHVNALPTSQGFHLIAEIKRDGASINNGTGIQIGNGNIPRVTKQFKILAGDNIAFTAMSHNAMTTLSAQGVPPDFTIMRIGEYDENDE